MAISIGDLSTPDGLKQLDEYLLTRSYISGFQASRDDLTVYSALKSFPKGYTNAARWYTHIKALLGANFAGPGVGVVIGGAAPAAAAPTAAVATPPAAEAKPAEDEEDDDDLDLFGEATEEEKAAAAEREAKAAASGKKKESGKSSVLLDVKPWDDETDMAKLEAAVRKVEMDGLLWGASKLVPVGARPLSTFRAATSWPSTRSKGGGFYHHKLKACPASRACDWTTSCTDCHEDCATTCCALFCPCVLVGRTTEIVTDGESDATTSCCLFFFFQLVMLGCLYSQGVRNKLRQKYVLPPRPCGDCLMHCACLCCSIAQEIRELKNRGWDPKRGYEENMRILQARGLPPPPQSMLLLAAVVCLSAVSVDGAAPPTKTQLRAELKKLTATITKKYPKYAKYSAQVNRAINVALNSRYNFTALKNSTLLLMSDAVADALAKRFKGKKISTETAYNLTAVQIIATKYTQTQLQAIRKGQLLPTQLKGLNLVKMSPKGPNIMLGQVGFPRATWSTVVEPQMYVGPYFIAHGVDKPQFPKGTKLPA
ncbi:unnamed protein product [Closterium sp. Yama58-4]|nr:unnamed protein product [Closterium sp. Yama58-4]